jgi:hypothetical protein
MAADLDGRPIHAMVFANLDDADVRVTQPQGLAKALSR